MNALGQGIGSPAVLGQVGPVMPTPGVNQMGLAFPLVAGATSYTAKYRSAGNGAYMTGVSGPGSPLTVTGLTANPYDFIVLASNSAGAGPASAPVTATPAAAAQARRVVAHGNSLVEGHYPGGDASESAVGGKYYAWVNQYLRAHPGDSGRNQGHSGFTLAQLTDYVNQGELDALFSTDSAVQNWYWLEELTNSGDPGQAGQNFTAQQLYDQYKALVLLVKSKYPTRNLKVGVLTGYPRGTGYDAAYNAKLEAVNALLRADHGFANVLADVRTAACLENVARMQDPRPSFDQTHLTPDGNTLVYKLVEKAMNAGSGIVTLTSADITLPATTTAPTPSVSRNPSTGALTVTLDNAGGIPLTETIYRDDTSNDVYYVVPANELIANPPAGNALAFRVRYAPNRIASAKAYPINVSGGAQSVADNATLLLATESGQTVGRTVGSGEGFGSSGFTAQPVALPAAGHTTTLDLPTVRHETEKRTAPPWPTRPAATWASPTPTRLAIRTPSPAP